MNLTKYGLQCLLMMIISLNLQAQEQQEYYVSAKSGLNYRDAPMGKKLGVFGLNCKLQVVKKTSVEGKVQSEGQPINGHWVGVAKESDTVYVFDGFLSESRITRPLELFYADIFFDYGNRQVPGFVNLSQVANWSVIPEPENNIGRETHSFDKTQTRRVLNQMGISMTDTLYIYGFVKDTVYQFPVNELKAAIRVDPYRSGYEVGLNYEKKYLEKGDNLAVIWHTNPFQTGETRPLIWKEVANETFPEKPFTTEEYSSWQTYTFSYAHYQYFIQEHNIKKGNWKGVDVQHLVVVDTNTRSTTFNRVYQSSEGVMLANILTDPTAPRSGYSHSWTGALFKDKPPIIYNMYSSSFGCIAVDFFGKDSRPMEVMCDNRH